MHSGEADGDGALVDTAVVDSARVDSAGVVDDEIAVDVITGKIGGQPRSKMKARPQKSGKIRVAYTRIRSNPFP